MPGEGASPAEVGGRRRDVLRMLKEATKPLSITDMAGRLDVHANTVRFHLQTLLSNGQVEQVAADRRSAGRPPQLFRAARGMDPTGPRQYRVLAEVFAGSVATGPDPSAHAFEAGRVWGLRQASAPPVTPASKGEPETQESVQRLVTMLDELGFAPDRRGPGGQQIGLGHCPFLDLATTMPTVVCSVHLGLMEGALQAWESPVTVDRLEPFVEPDLCLAHLDNLGVH